MVKTKSDKTRIKETAKKWCITAFVIFLSGVVRAIGIHSFVLQNGFAPGGVTGVATLLEVGTKISSGVYLFLLNIPLLLIAFFCINKKFALKTAVAILLSSLLLMLLKQIHFPAFAGDNTGDRMLYALAGGLMGGFGIAILIKVGGSSGGTDIFATLIQRKFSATNVAWFIFLLDSTVVLASIFVFNNGITPVLLAFIEMFASSKVMEMILQGFKAAIKFEVVTPSPEALSAEIIQKLHRGVTVCKATGMYTHEDKAIVICLVRKRQVSQFRAILKNYPNTFAYVSSASEVMGYGFN